jgi:hypothetical protein
MLGPGKMLDLQFEPVARLKHLIRSVDPGRSAKLHGLDIPDSSFAIRIGEENVFAANKDPS